MLYFVKNVMIAQKAKFLILFTSQINIEWIKDSYVVMDLLYKKLKNNNFGSVFGVLLATWMTRKKRLGYHKFFSKDPLEKKKTYKASTFPHLQKSFKKS
jgi:hypothetical protein